jgi:hypothetical protein
MVGTISLWIYFIEKEKPEIMVRKQLLSINASPADEREKGERSNIWARCKWLSFFMIYQSE